jgi:hypothetical protein
MRTTRIIFGLSLACLLFSLPAVGQTTTSNIEGTVTDANGAVIAGAEVKASATTLASERSTTSDAEGFYRLTALPAGSYTLAVSRTGFARSTSNIELTLNRVVTLNIQLQVGDIVGGVASVSADALPLLETNASSTGATVTPQQIRDLPVNGRNYLDLLQLIPGVAVNRQADPEGDNGNPVLGERSGNNNFFIDGHPNKDNVSGGPAAQFNQETIEEFQVLTTGYKAEFGQASGAIVNVITKSGGNAFHGAGSFFLRNEAFDSSNSLDPTITDPPSLRRFDYSAALGGPIIKDKMFFFASGERIREDRHIGFTYPDVGNAAVNQLIRGLESSFDTPTPSRETRLFLKLNEQLGRHSLSQEANYTNGNVRNFAPLSAGNSVPSTRTDRGARNLLLAFGDTILLGDQGDPWILTLRGAYRGEPSDILPAHPEAGGSNILTAYPVPVTAALQVPGPLPTVNFGNSLTRSFLDQQYTALAANADKRFGDHDIKFGWNFLRTKVDGLEPRTLANQLFTTIPDFSAFDAVVSGVSLLSQSGGTTPADDEVHLRNNYNALFVQDDWKIRNNLTLNLGLRWEQDSEFEAKKNFGPRLGVAWGITPKTVVRAQLGIFYDQFRLGIARGVPQFGGANQVTSQVLLFPRGLFGSPNFISSAGLLLLGSGPCFSNFSVPGGNNLTDAQITAAGRTCPLKPSQAFIGVDRLNNVVAAGHAPIPANVPITIGNIQSLSGLTPDQYLAAANTAVGFPGFFTWGPFGQLTNPIIPPFGAPDSLENIDKTPNTLGFSVGVQREIAKDMVVAADYHHRKIRNLLGVRLSNLAFRARVAGQARSFDPPGASPITSFGPYYEGKYDGLVLSLNKRFGNKYLFGANYTFANATDNSRGAGLLGGVGAFPSDSFIGTVPVVTEASTGTTNANGSFVSTNGNFVAQAGTFWNGPDVDKGASDLAVDHIFQINGMVSLPWQFQISGIFRAQSGFHHSKQFAGTTQTPFIDPDGDGATNTIDVRNSRRNAFTSPPFVNLDLRFTKRFDIGEQVKIDLFYEIFNVFNRQNPASINTQPAASLFGTVQQVLPGREGQVGLRIQF